MVRNSVLVVVLVFTIFPLAAHARSRHHKRHRHHHRRGHSFTQAQASVPLTHAPKTSAVRTQPALLPVAHVATPPIQPQSVSVHTARHGDTMTSLLAAQGFTHREINQLSLSRAIPTHTYITQGHRYLVAHYQNPRRTLVKFYLPYNEEALLFSKGAAEASIQRVSVSYNVVPKTYSGLIRGGLGSSVKRVVDSARVVSRLEDAFAFDFDLSSKLMKNSAFQFVVEEQYDMGQFIDFGDVLDVKFTIDGTEHRRVLRTANGAKIFVNPSHGYEDRAFFAPVGYLHISSPFSQRRLHPVRHNYQPHLGVDFADAEGTPVLAARDGEIAEIGYRRGNGNFVVIRHAGDYETYYNHLGEIRPTLQIGSKITAGEQIGGMGCTGFCTGTHLDFRIKKGDTLFNPVYMLKPFPAPAQKLVEQEAGQKVTSNAKVNF